MNHKYLFIICFYPSLPKVPLILPVIAFVCQGSQQAGRFQSHMLYDGALQVQGLECDGETVTLMQCF